MSTKTRMLTCQATKIEFPYRGFGRPPLYCPAEAKRRQVEQRKRASAKAKQAKKALRKAA